MKLSERERVYRPPLRAKFPIDESLIERQEQAKRALEARGVEVRADRKREEVK